MISDEDTTRALDRIARTPDGTILYRCLQKVLCGVSGTTEGGALQNEHGRRSLARDLMARMAQGIDESSSARSESDRPVTFAVAGPVRAVSAARGAARRVTLTDAERGGPEPA